MFTSIPIEHHTPKVDVTKRVIVSVDQSYAQDFAINEFGHVRSDVTLLMSSQSEDEVKLLMSRFTELPNYSPDTVGLSDGEILSSLVPRSCQSPAQISRYYATMAKRLDEKAKLAAKADSKVSPSLELDKKPE